MATLSLFSARRDAGAWSVHEILAEVATFSLLSVRWSAGALSAPEFSSSFQPRLAKSCTAAPRKKYASGPPDVYFFPRRGCGEFFQPRLRKQYASGPPDVFFLGVAAGNPCSRRLIGNHYSLASENPLQPLQGKKRIRRAQGCFRLR